MSEVIPNRHPSLVAASVRRRRRALGSLIAICVLAYLPSLRHWWYGSWPFGEDSMAAFGVWREFTQAALRRGVLPLWNPYLFCGMPFMSNGQTSILYPPNVVYWLMPVPLALWFDALGHQILLACGTYALARALRLSRSAAWLVAVSWSLSGPVAAHIFNGHMTWHAARAYLPWQLWALLSYLRTSNRNYIHIWAICFALQILSGYPPLVVLSVGWCVGLLGAWIIARYRERQQHTALSAEQRPPLLPSGWWKVAAFAAAWAFLLTAVCLLPLREVSRLAVHGQGLTYRLAMASSGNWRSLVRLLLPEFFGNNDFIQWSLFVGAHEEAGYCGLLATVLAIGAPYLAWRRPATAAQDLAENSTPSDSAATAPRHLPLPLPVLCLWPLLWFTIVLAMGENTRVYPWLFQHIGLLHMVRVPARWLETSCFIATLLAGFSFDGCLHRARALPAQTAAKARAMVGAFLLLVVVLGGLWLWLQATAPRSTLWMETAQWNRARPPDVQIAAAKILRDAALYATGVGWLLAVVMATLAGAWQGIKRPATRRTVEKLLLGVVLLDMLGLFWRSDKFLSVPALHNMVLWPPSAVRQYRRGERWDTSNLILESMNQAMPLGIDLFNGYDTMGTRRFFRYVEAVENAPFWGAAYDASHKSPLLRVTGLTHTLVFNFNRAGKPEWTFLPRPGAWPRVYLTRRLVRQPEASQIKTLTALAARDFAAQGQPAVLNLAACGTIPAAPLGPQERILSWQRDLNEMQVTTDTHAPTVLVQSEAWYPGWHSWVNGQAVPIEQANWLFRAVRVPAGRAQVRAVYEPATYRLGLFISLWGLALSVALGSSLAARRNHG